ncbi:IPT/TIG domain-containing protein [Mucilaginibacter sp.]|jgi:streptogramin lyase|uniref:IPT/TIG domain-containing protein n=1 Tax=Mucilaginibacter sp. TaxID=1882438 RepID=UPI002C846F26|nr:IPT/TIG domain-containing protein [Mucilaginibacter sp.]HTI59220.1 IPT/TIG domain-containing protein [Mucilaginibacter sp.]
MKAIKPYYLFLFSAVIAFTISSCKKSDAVKPSLTLINAVSVTGGYGDTITLRGTNLPTAHNPVVTVNDQSFEIAEVTSTSFKAVVPKMVGSGKVSVKVDGITYDGPDFVYKYKAVVTTLAGSGDGGSQDGLGGAASFNCPWGTVADDNGDLYIADCYNRLIRKITPTGTVSTIHIPITINGATFFSPNNIALDKATHTLYVTDFNAHLLKINADNSMVVIYDGPSATSGIAVGSDGFLYMANNITSTIFKLSTDGSTATPIATNIVTPRNIIFDKSDNMYVAGYDPIKGQAAIFQVARDGYNRVIYDDPDFKGWEIAVDRAGNFYEADHFNNVIKIIDKNGKIAIIAGSGNAEDVDGVGLAASFNGPQGLAIDADGNLYVSTYNYDTGGGNKIRKIVVY